jgi:hypothetical protein
MAWENPVTTWGQAGKTVPVAGDFNRIEGNTQYLKDEVDSHKAEDASTTAKGHVQLSSSTSSTSTSLAATASAVSTVNNSLNNHISSKSVHGLKDTTVAIGAGSSAPSYSSVAVGEDAKALGGHSLALGPKAEVPDYYIGSIAIGWNASAQNNYSMALGVNTETSSSEATAIGFGALANNTFDVVLGHNGNNVKVPGNFRVSGTKNFEIPHPKPEKKATHIIRHGAVESPTPGDTLYRWKVQATKDNDLVTIDLPDYFIYLNKDVQIWVTGQGHFGNGYGELNEETEQLEIHCQFEGEYNVLVIGTRNDDHQSVQDWNIKGVEREIGESWTGETYAFSVDEIIEVEEIKEVV